MRENAPEGRASRAGLFTSDNRISRKSLTYNPWGWVSLLPNAARTDILTANEPQPIDPLLVRQADALRAFGHIAPDCRQRLRHSDPTTKRTKRLGPR